MVSLDWYDKKTVVVFGAAGFIGSNVCIALCELGANVIGIDGMFSLSGANRYNLELVKGKMLLIEQKVQQVEALETYIAEADLLINCMGFTSHKLGMVNPLLDLEMNLVATISVIEGIRRAKYTKKVVQLGSKGQYGKTSVKLITEDHPLLPIDVQGINKLSAEQYLQLYAHLMGFQVISLRIPNCFGPRQKLRGEDVGMFGEFLLTALQGGEILVYQGSSPRRRDLMFVDDLVPIILTVGQDDLPTWSVFNVSSYNLSILEIAKTIIEVVQQGTYRVEPIPLEIDVRDLSSMPFDCERIQKAYGWAPNIDFPQGVIKTVSFIKNHEEEYLPYREVG